MSIEYALILTVLISLGTYDITQAEVIRGVDIPRVNVSRIVGKWYRLSADAKYQSLSCSTSVIEQLSNDSYRINFTLHFRPDAKKNHPHIPDKSVELVFTVTLLKDSSIMVVSINGREGSTVIFDIDYDSYMALYVTSTTEEIADGTSGNIMVIGRQKTLPEGILEKIKQSNFYIQGTPHDYELLSYDASDCE